jgi:hypothetical protein
MWHTGQVHVTPGLKFYILELMCEFGSSYRLEFLKYVSFSEGLSVYVVSNITAKIYW